MDEAAEMVPLERLGAAVPALFAPVVALGCDAADAAGRGDRRGGAFRRFVAAVDEALAESALAEGSGVRLLAHLRAYAARAEPAIAQCVVGGAQIPVVGGARAPLFGAMRAYMHAVVCRTCGDWLEPAQALAAVLIALANGGGGALLDAEVNSTYSALAGQNGPDWALLHGALSGHAIAEADQIASVLLASEDKYPGVGRVAAALCGATRTRMGMLVFSYSRDGGAHFPVAELAAFFASRQLRNSVIDALLGSVTARAT